MSAPVLSVVIPAHNEAGSLPKTINALEFALTQASIPHEILVVDDHSTDGTYAVVQQLQQTRPTLRVVSNERPGGFGHAVQTGIDLYQGDAFCLVMADGSDDPEDVVRYYGEFSKGSECVFGSRFVPGSRVIDYPLHKLLLNRLANLFIRLLFGLQYNDVTNAFKCYGRHVLDGLRPILSHHFNLTVELPLKAIIRGYSYKVVPINWYGRVHGISKLRIREMGSRYLFIVLYAFLERVLSRGDYKRAQAAPLEGSGDATAVHVERPAWLALLFVAIVHLLFAYTFPLNHLGGDTSGYYHVLTTHSSNLLFAPGYPFLFGFLLRVDAIAIWFVEHQPLLRRILLYSQHLAELASLALLLVALTRVYGRRTAAIAIIIAGCSARAMGVTSSVYPEWLQGSFLVASFSFGLLAFTAQSMRAKTILYSAASMSFIWCVLTKFNAAPFALGLLAFFLFEKIPWRDRFRMAAIAAAVALLNLAVFVIGFHRPETGTYALTHDRSWVLMAKLSNVYGELPHRNGLETKRWLALSSMLPPNYAVASVGIFMHLDSVPPEVRKPWREKAGYLLTADEKTLDAVLARNPLPPGFSLGVSSIPISYYIGLPESDELGVRVFFESIRHAPAPYVRDVLRETWAARNYATTEPTFPDARFISGVTEKAVRIGPNTLRLERLPHSPLPYGSSEPLMWRPGYYLFSAVDALSPSRRMFVFVLALGVALALWHGFRYGWELRNVMMLALAILLIGSVVFSAAVLAFRWKEWRLVYPLASVLAAAALGWAIPQVVQAFTRRT